MTPTRSYIHAWADRTQVVSVLGFILLRVTWNCHRGREDGDCLSHNNSPRPDWPADRDKAVRNPKLRRIQCEDFLFYMIYRPKWWNMYFSKWMWSILKALSVQSFPRPFVLPLHDMCRHPGVRFGISSLPARLSEALIRPVSLLLIATETRAAARPNRGGGASTSGRWAQHCKKSGF